VNHTALVSERMLSRSLIAALLIASLPAYPAETKVTSEPDCPSPPTVLAGAAPVTSRGLLANLEGFLQQRNIDPNRLTAEAMVDLMIDWYRFAPMGPPGSAADADTLVYRYGGWSEGCATGFKFSLLRQVGERGTGGDADRIAGITLMFEPSGRAELAPFAAVSSESKSIERFLEIIQSSPAFRQLGTAKPMAVMLESGGLR
jgi:hypothetical protein